MKPRSEPVGDDAAWTPEDDRECVACQAQTDDAMTCPAFVFPVCPECRGDGSFETWLEGTFRAAARRYVSGDAAANDRARVRRYLTPLGCQVLPEGGVHA